MDHTTTLSHELAIWRDWARQASRQENGWESDAPNWDQLMQLAKSTLVGKATLQQESELAVVIGLSEEAEELADFLKSNLHRVPPQRIRRLLSSTDPKVRWQVYDSLVQAQAEWFELLVGGMNDPDSHVRRRAFLRLLADFEVPRELLEAALGDSDNVIRTEAEVQLRRLAGSL